jgi:tetratricopeptide (TPR) repeat protein
LGRLFWGNGERFTAEFERACLRLLEAVSTGNSPAHRHQVQALPAEEIIRRAFAVMRQGQEDAARRILAHCLREYPDNGTAHVLAAQLTASAQRFDEAVGYLKSCLPRLTGRDRWAALICLARFHIMLGQPERSLDICRQLDEMHIDDPIDQLQVEFFKAALASSEHPDTPAAAGEQPPLRIRLLVPCDNLDQFRALENRILSSCLVSKGSTLTVTRVDESRRITAYRAALADVAGADLTVFMQKNIELHRSDVFAALRSALEEADIVGFSGASRWCRLDWRLDAFESKTAAFCISAADQSGFQELQWLGSDLRQLVPGMAVLDGGLFAVAHRALAEHPGLGELFDEELVGSEVLLEEDWIHSAGKAGCRLAVHRNLGVLVRTEVDLDVRYRQAARIHQATKLEFKAFDMVKDDRIAISAPVADMESGIRTLACMLGPQA